MALSWVSREGRCQEEECGEPRGDRANPQAGSVEWGEGELTLALPSGKRPSWCSQISPKHVVRTYCPLSGKCCAISWISGLHEYMS